MNYDEHMDEVGVELMQPRKMVETLVNLHGDEWERFFGRVRRRAARETDVYQRAERIGFNFDPLTEKSAGMKIGRKGLVSTNNGNGVKNAIERTVVFPSRVTVKMDREINALDQTMQLAVSGEARGWAQLAGLTVEVAATGDLSGWEHYRYLMAKVGPPFYFEPGELWWDSPMLVDGKLITGIGIADAAWRLNVPENHFSIWKKW